MSLLKLNDYQGYGTDCIAGKLPPCSCACPLNLDIRTIMGYVQSGKLTAAYKLFRDQSVFPAIVSEICTAPCKSACVRVSIDNAVDMVLLEKALVAFSKRKSPPPYNLPKKKEKIAIIGGGLAGLACASRLGAKSYDVTVFERSDVLGGRAHELMDSMTVATEIENQLQHARVRYALNTCVNIIDLIDTQEWDSILIATGKGGSDAGLLEDMDKQSFGTATPGVFLAGSILGAEPVEDIAQGIVAAHSIEKYFKTKMMDGIPETFMVRESEITKDMVAMSICPQTLPSSGSAYTEEEALRESGRCMKCDCTLCMEACELFDFFQKKPRQIATDAFVSVHSGRGSITKQTTTHLISSCNLCGLCRKVCPKGIDIGQLAYDFRRFKMRDKKYPKGYGDYYMRDMNFSNTEAAIARLAPGKEKAAYVFFPGCQLGASNPRYVTEAYKYLLSWRDDTAIFMYCCGAPADWGAEEDMNRDVIDAIKKHWESFGKPTIICACPTCMQQFAKFIPEAMCISIYEVMAENNVPKQNCSFHEKTVHVFDPCTSRDFPEMQRGVREILKQTGINYEELPYSGVHAQCCGAGAHTPAANLKLSEHMTINRIESGMGPYINYCTNCRDTFALWGKKCYHILDIVFGLGDSEECAYLPPTLGERRNNKVIAKNMILEKIFQESPPKKMNENFDIKVIISQELLLKMRKLFILEDEVYETIRYCEDTDLRIYDAEKDIYIGHSRAGMTTIWVVYKKESDCYTLVNVYSHRIRILEEGRDE